MSKVEDLDISSINALYYEMLLVAGPRQMPPKITSSFVGEKITQVVELMF